MTEAQRRASIARHAPFLTPAEKKQFMPSEAEKRAVERTIAIGNEARAWADRSNLERTAVAAVLLSALRRLHQVCLSMDLANDAERPTEGDYQQAMNNAVAAIARAGVAS